MGTLRRIGNVLLGLLMIFCSLFLVLIPESGYSFVMMVLVFSLVCRGLVYIFFYFFMARHMVGGRMILYTGVITLDLGIFAGTLVEVPKLYIILYLVGCHAVSGIVDILRALEAKRIEAPWKLNMLSGLGNMFFAFLCILFVRSETIVGYVYAVGLFSSACLKIASAFQKTAIVYVQ